MPTGHPDMLPAVDLVDTLAPEVLPGFIASLAALQARAAARLAGAAGCRSSAVAAPGEPTTAPPAHLDVGAAATLLGISPTALRRLERAGHVPSVRIGRRLLFRRQSLLAFMEHHEHTGSGRG